MKRNVCPLHSFSIPGMSRKLWDETDTCMLENNALKFDMVQLIAIAEGAIDLAQAYAGTEESKAATGFQVQLEEIKSRHNAFPARSPDGSILTPPPKKI